MVQPPAAAIDLGSHTIRLLVAAAEDGAPHALFLRLETTRLGEGLEPGRCFKPQALERTWRVLEDFRTAARELGADPILVGATGAVREATDGPALLARIELELGLRTRLLSGEEEAALAAAGVLAVLKPADGTFLLFDLGGRSTEFALVVKGEVRRAVSLGLGALGLTERFFGEDPPGAEAARALREEAARVLAAGLAVGFAAERTGPLIGACGTATTCAAVLQGLEAYDPARINGYGIARQAQEALFERLVRLAWSERLRIPGMSPALADILPAGAGVILEILDYFKQPYLLVSDAGLLEGLWLVAAGVRSETWRATGFGARG
jgi:exopolyphosphatase/guanosine-5'-triphosphate,3'-diphosphate pyrophosphatase